ncbi:uncharacterized protein LOC124812681 [Hydra vulgaris]|uniref:uncharacterized protein LOC124812681 n=1 Tax=Hydra vulgaris TaxID=6087 RepID=UPI001F5F3846|nr:uncharacterized protein LOC124812681 [Hydra vulgaris]
MSPSGWMEEDQFVQWINSVFIPFKNVNCEGRVVLIADDHLTHVFMAAIQLYQKYNIDLVILPSRSSKFFQSLDSNVYSHVKNVWRAILQQHYRETGFRNVGKLTFPLLLFKLHSLEQDLKISHAVRGFKSINLYPLNKNAVNKEKLKLSEL